MVIIRGLCKVWETILGLIQMSAPHRVPAAALPIGRGEGGSGVQFLFVFEADGMRCPSCPVRMDGRYFMADLLIKRPAYRPEWSGGGGKHASAGAHLAHRLVRTKAMRT